MPYIEKDTRDRSKAEFWVWAHDKKSVGGIGQSRVIARRFVDEVKSDFHDLPVGNTRQIGEDDWAIYDISRVA